MPFKSKFLKILVDSGQENGANMVPKSDRKSIATLKAKNQLNASWLAFSWVSGIEVGSKSQPKIYPKI